jgi:hypothetical protein
MMRGRVNRWGASLHREFGLPTATLQPAPQPQIFHQSSGMPIQGLPPLTVRHLLQLLLPKLGSSLSRR